MKILLHNRFRYDNGSLAKLTVDGSDFRTYLHGNNAALWFSHKYKGPGIRYEIAIAIQTGDICHTGGPFPAGQWPDIKIFRSCLKQKLVRENRFCREKVEADKGYAGEPFWICLPDELGGGEARQKSAKGRARTRHETVNRRFKQWKSLGGTFRHGIERHGKVFNAIAVITQIDIRTGNPPFQVEYRTMETEDEKRVRLLILERYRNGRGR